MQARLQQEQQEAQLQKGKQDAQALYQEWRQVTGGRKQPFATWLRTRLTGGDQQSQQHQQQQKPRAPMQGYIGADGLPWQAGGIWVGALESETATKQQSLSPLEEARQLLF
jgi:hypothetical protein